MGLLNCPKCKTEQGVLARYCYQCGSWMGIPSTEPPRPEPPQASPAAPPAGVGDEYLAAVLEIDRVMRPHKERLFLAMREWVKTRTPNELIAHIEAGLATPSPAEGHPDLDMQSPVPFHDLGQMRAILEDWDAYSKSEREAPGSTASVRAYEKMQVRYAKLITRLRTPSKVGPAPDLANMCAQGHQEVRYDHGEADSVCPVCRVISERKWLAARLKGAGPDLEGARDAFREALRVYRLNLQRWDVATTLVDKQRYMAWMNEAEEKLFTVLASQPSPRRSPEGGSHG